MANPNAIVSRFVRLTGRTTGVAPEQLAIELDDGRRVRLDPQNSHSEGFARVLAGLSELRHPVYLEIDPRTDGVSRILVPAVGHVRELREVAYEQARRRRPVGFSHSGRCTDGSRRPCSAAASSASS